MTRLRLALRELWANLTWTYPMGMSRRQAIAWMREIAEQSQREFIMHQKRCIRELKRILEENEE
jgi:hypothetical protein